MPSVEYPLSEACWLVITSYLCYLQWQRVLRQTTILSLYIYLGFFRQLCQRARSPPTRTSLRLNTIELAVLLFVAYLPWPSSPIRQPEERTADNAATLKGLLRAPRGLTIPKILSILNDGFRLNSTQSSRMSLLVMYRVLAEIRRRSRRSSRSYLGPIS